MCTRMCTHLLCVRIFAAPLHVFVCLHPEMWPCEPATMCMCMRACSHICVYVCFLACMYVCVPVSGEEWCSSFPPLPASAQCHSEEPGGDSRGRGDEALTAATCHISQLKFGGNQFGTLIRSTTPTPGAAEEPRPPAGSPSCLPSTPPAPKDEESTPRGHKSSILNQLLQTNGSPNPASPAKLNYYWIDKKLLRIFLKEGREG